MLLKDKTFIQRIVIFCFLITAVFLFSSIAHAQPDLGTNQLSNLTLNPDVNPYRLIVRVINIFLSFLGIIAVILVLWAGWLWMSSQGNPEQIGRAKKILINAFIGILIILSAFGLVNWFLGTWNGMGGSGGSGNNRFGNYGAGFGSSGNSIIEYHYPERNQKGVPRNTSIIITFKEPIRPEDLIEDTNPGGIYGDFNDSNGNGRYDSGEVFDKLNGNNILIYKTTAGSGPENVTDAMANVMPDNKTFRFKPREYLGSPSENVEYTVELSTKIRKQNGDLAFPGKVDKGYYWVFEASTIIDVTPPKIESIIPVPDKLDFKNVIVTLNFNEPINPISASGQVPGFTNLEVATTSGALSARVNGNFYISNHYKTVEFFSDNACGTNACGDVVYCLPAPADIRVTAKAAELLTSGEPTAVFTLAGYNGIVDMADNSLDGNSDGKADGPTLPPVNTKPAYNMNNPDAATQGDDYQWSFKTKDEKIVTAPVLTGITPEIGSSTVMLNYQPVGTFNRMISAKSLVKKTLKASGSVALYMNPDKPFFLGLRNTVIDANTDRADVTIEHDSFEENATSTAVFNSGVKDTYQNCYRPSRGPVGCTDDPPLQPYCCNGAWSAVECNN